MRSITALTRREGAFELDDIDGQAEGIVQPDPSQLFVHVRARLSVVVKFGAQEVSGGVDWDENDEVQRAYGRTYSRRPRLGIEPLRIVVRRQIREKVERAAVEENVRRRVVQAAKGYSNWASKSSSEGG